VANTNKTKNKSITLSTKKNSTGTTTESGKKASSKNALIHGATSKNLLNDVEHKRYIDLLADLKGAYPNQNPLLQMQLENSKT